MTLDLNKLAQRIIEQNQYMTIASSDKDGNAWVSPVVYAYDNDWNFYFVSIPNSKHCLNFKENNKISVAIFDSHQDWGEGIGLQIEGEIKKLKLTEISNAIKIYFKRNYPYGTITEAFGKGLKNMLNKKLYRLYKLSSIRIWINNPNSDTDERAEVELSNN
ncbi:pyridoxamine 5'-phosphate oxidase family protein [Candidatus Parcubacteria bacterium]|nr:MAG: pyridoxamine 5'-phosphate oxidase family protein [Candidatus Parcubacteria bacterium]